MSGQPRRTQRKKTNIRRSEKRGADQATAAVDRLRHHAHVIITEGTSLRRSKATTGRGVIPLA